MMKLAKALSLAQAEMPAIGKDSVNPHFRSKFASLAAIVTAMRPVLAKHGLSVIQWPICEGAMIGLNTALMHESGEMVEGRFWIPVAEKDLGNPQSFGKLMTYLRRYSLCAILGIVADDDDDAESLVRPQASLDETYTATPQQKIKLAEIFKAMGVLDGEAMKACSEEAVKAKVKMSELKTFVAESR